MPLLKSGCRKNPARNFGVWQVLPGFGIKQPAGQARTLAPAWLESPTCQLDSMEYISKLAHSSYSPLPESSTPITSQGWENSKESRPCPLALCVDKRLN